MYKFGKADKVIPMEDGSGYKLMIWVDGKYVPMVALGDDGEWHVSVFPTKGTAYNAMSSFNEVSWAD